MLKHRHCPHAHIPWIKIYLTWYYDSPAPLRKMVEIFTFGPSSLAYKGYTGGPHIRGLGFCGFELPQIGNIRGGGKDCAIVQPQLWCLCSVVCPAHALLQSRVDAWCPCTSSLPPSPPTDMPPPTMPGPILEPYGTKRAKLCSPL